MKRIILVVLVSSVLLTGCRLRDKVNDKNEDASDEVNNESVIEDINDIESILNDLNHLETNSDEIAEEDLVSE